MSNENTGINTGSSGDVLGTAIGTAIGVGNPTFQQPNLTLPAFRQQFTTHQCKSPGRAEYKTQLTSRVAIPIRTLLSGMGSMEMTLDVKDERLTFTILVPGKQSLEFTIHRKDMEALAAQITLDNLAK